MMHEKYTIFAYPKIDNIYLVWDDHESERGSKCIFVYIGGLQYRLVLSFVFWRDLLSTVSNTHSSGIYTLTSIANTNGISYWENYTKFNSIQSLIEDLKGRTLLEAL